MIHFCRECGHSFDTRGLLADGGDECRGRLIDIPEAEWALAVQGTTARLTDRGKLIIASLQDKQGEKS